MMFDDSIRQPPSRRCDLILQTSFLAKNWQFDTQNKPKKAPVLRVFTVMGLRCRAIIRTDIGKNDVLTVLSDSHRLIDEF